MNLKDDINKLKEIMSPKMWEIVTALRGPDADDMLDMKIRITGRIRWLVTGYKSRGFTESEPLTEEKVDEIVNDEDGIYSLDKLPRHYLEHSESAIRILYDGGMMSGEEFAAYERLFEALWDILR